MKNLIILTLSCIIVLIYRKLPFQDSMLPDSLLESLSSLIAKFMGPTWVPSGADRTQVGPMLAPWTLLSGLVSFHTVNSFEDGTIFIYMHTLFNNGWRWNMYTAGKKVTEYLKSTMETLVFDILIWGKWFGTNHKKYWDFIATLTCSILGENAIFNVRN